VKPAERMKNDSMLSCPPTASVRETNNAVGAELR